MLYRDGKNGAIFIKRFNVTGVTRDKVYDLTKGTKDSEVIYFTANPNGEAEVVEIQLKPMAGLRKMQWDISFSDLAVKGRSSMGNIVTKYAVKKVVLKQKGVSTLAAIDVWFDDIVHRLNNDKRGTFLGSFGPDDKILTMTQSGYYRLTGIDVSTHFDEDMILIEKFRPNKIASIIYWEGESKTYFVKRFEIEPTDKKTLFITETEGSRVEMVTTEENPVVEVKFSKVKDKELPNEQINLSEFIEVKGMKAKGNKLSFSKVKEINLLVPDEVHIDEEMLDEFDETGLSPLEAIKKNKEAEKPKPEKNLLSIDQQLNEKMKLPSEEKKKKKKGKGKDGDSQITMPI